MSLKNTKFAEYLEFIYPRELEIKETTKTAASSSYLDCYLYIDNGKLATRLYDKRDDFNFPIVNFPFLSSNIPSAPAYGVYVSQLIRYARACPNYQDFMERGKVLNYLFQHTVQKVYFNKSFLPNILLFRSIQGSSRGFLFDTTHINYSLGVEKIIFVSASVVLAVSGAF